MRPRVPGGSLGDFGWNPPEGRGQTGVTVAKETTTRGWEGAAQTGPGAVVYEAEAKREKPTSKPC